MSRRIGLIFENGVFKPVEAVDWLHEHELVQAEVHTLPTPPNNLKEFPFRDLSWLVPMSDEDADLMLKVIEEEFGQVDDDEIEPL